MNTIKYEVIHSMLVPSYAAPFTLRICHDAPVETGSIGYDCAALIKFPGRFKTSKAEYEVLGTQIDISANEPVLRIYVDADRYDRR